MEVDRTTFYFALTTDPYADLHDGHSRRDILRHDQRVRKAIQGNLPEIISREDIVSSDGKKLVKVPVRGVELPRFRFDPYEEKHVGQGDEGTRGQGGQGSGQPGKGRTAPGTVLGQAGQGQGKEAGQQPGADIYETEITIDDLVELAFADLELPNLEEKGKDQMEVRSVRYDTIRKTGPQANLDPRRTLIEAWKRSAREGKAGWKIDPLQDPRYRSWEETVEPRRNAVVFAMRDVSGSIGEFEAYLTRSFYAWMVRFLKRRYVGVETVFITCHTHAQEVDENNFFRAGSSGGTRMASAYEKALEIIDQRYNPSCWNIYPFLFSDGYNWGDEQCVDLVRKFLPVSNLVGYGELNNYGHWSGQSDLFKGSERWAPLGTLYEKSFGSDPRFVQVQIGRKEDVWPALRKFMKQRHKELAA